MARALPVLALLLGAALPAVPAHAQQEDRPVPRWLVLGSFPTEPGRERLSRTYVGVPEGELAPAEGEALAGERWRSVAADEDGRIDFNAVFPGPARENAAAYAMAYLTSPADRTLTLEVRSDDDVRVWLNGTLVLDHAVPRGINSGADTLTLRLARGTNRLLYKVLNRTGGFGLGARVLALSPDLISDVAFSVTRPAAGFAAGPAPTLTLSAPAMPAAAVLRADGAASELTVPLRVRAARWGGLTGPLTLELAGRAVSVPDSAQGRSVPFDLALGWGELARAARERPVFQARLPDGQTLDVPFAPDPGSAAALLAGMITVDGWLRTSARPVPEPGGPGWTALAAAPDSAATALAFRAVVPPVLAGLTLELDAAEFTPPGGGSGTVTVNGSAREPDELGRLTLCAPCRAGAPLDVVVALGSEEWWDAPRLRVADAGWHEIRQGAHWARYFLGEEAVALPDRSVADALMAASMAPDKADYHALVAAWLERLAPAVAELRADTVDLVGNSHIDAAWLWRWPETVDVVRNTWRTGTKLLRKYPDMTYAASAARYYTWLEEYEPELLARLQVAAAEGRWEPVGGWWVEPDANMPSGESVVRQGLYGQQTFQRLFGRYARVGWIPDTFGYAYSLPQIFRGLGLEYLVTQKLRWNDTNDWTSDRNLFWWQGRDGTRLLTYIPYGYSHELQPDALAREWRASRDSTAVARMLVLYGVGDHGGGPTMAMLDRKRELERVPAFPVLRDALPSASLDGMRAAAPPSVPVIDDELYLEYHRGVLTSQAAIKAWNRRMEGLLAAAERAAVVAGGFYPAETLRKAWELTLFNQFHDILPGSSIGPVYVDAVDDYERAEALASGVLEDALRRMGVGVEVAVPAGLEGARSFLVFNPSGRSRSGVVRLDGAWLGPAGPLVRDAGNPQPSWRRGDTVFVEVADVPATGVKVIHLAPSRLLIDYARPVGPGILQNEMLRAEIDTATGELRRLVDRRTGREVLAAPGNALVLSSDRPAQWDAWNLEGVDLPVTPVRGQVSVGPVQVGPPGQWLEVRRTGPGIDVTQRYALRGGRLDIETTLDWSADHQLLRAVFPLAVEADSVWSEIPYGAIGRPVRPSTAVDSARWEKSMHRWVDVSDGTFGVAVVNDGKYGFDMSGDSLRLTLLKAPTYPDENADRGRHRFTYSLVPHAGDWRAPEVLAAAEELNEPLRVVEVTAGAGGAAGAAEREAGFVEILEGSAVLGALKRAEDGGDVWVVRLVEREGRPTTARVRLPFAARVEAADLLERPLAEGGTWEGSVVEVPLGAWEIVTLLMRPAGG